jgi:hypothetical protein
VPGEHRGERSLVTATCPSGAIENLRSGSGPLYAAYDGIFSGFSGDERAVLFYRTAERWHGQRDPS